MNKKVLTFLLIAVFIVIIIIAGGYYFYKNPIDNNNVSNSEESNNQQVNNQTCEEEGICQEDEEVIGEVIDGIIQTDQKEALEGSESEPLIEFNNAPSNVILSASVTTIIEGENIDFTWSADEVTFYNIRMRPDKRDWMDWASIPLERSSIPFNIAGKYDVQIQACNNLGCTESSIIPIIIT